MHGVYVYVGQVRVVIEALVAANGGETKMTTLVEIDTRIIPGTNGGSVVVWELGCNGNRHQITLHATGSVPRTVYRGSDAAKANDAFTHTFAHEDVPDVFAHEPLTPMGA